MPELPEVEHLRRSLKEHLIGATIGSVRLMRNDALRSCDDPLSATRQSAALLRGGRIMHLERHGKQLAIVAEDGRTLCVHLGMSGQLRFLSRGSRLSESNHVHCTWQIVHNNHIKRGRLIFRDPRRFGGLRAFASLEDLRERQWRRLGPDALSIRAGVLRKRLGQTRRAIKAAMLDQHVLAGVGNIYADEILFRAGIDPRTPGAVLSAEQIKRVASWTRRVLREAIAAGGTTLRNYADGNGVAGTYVQRHAVYGRAGEACVCCGSQLVRAMVSQRTTVFCGGCQQADDPVITQQ